MAKPLHTVGRAVVATELARVCDVLAAGSCRARAHAASSHAGQRRADLRRAGASPCVATAAAGTDQGARLAGRGRELPGATSR